MTTHASLASLCDAAEGRDEEEARMRLDLGEGQDGDDWDIGQK